ncbi:MAG TPA: CoA transferase [Burkholderiales bacterium]|jgi:crotonobetainyl-CoA:carnitine CoA-transferase CaiB-like acyl-CoA transferase|nr:CoA transferase [Burkholderiales bacterium]
MRPFEGVKILDCTHVLAGPFAAYQLAVLGADVIKVEDPNEPDQSRESGADMALNKKRMGTGFLTQGSNKRSIALNLKTEGGREALKRLVKDWADVFIENYRPGALKALGLGYEDFSRLNPKLVYASMTAFGQDGPRGNMTAYDHAIQATSGITATTGTETSGPTKVGAPVIDYAVGTTGAFAISAALYQTLRTGKGQHIDMAMLDVALILQASHITDYFHSGHTTKRAGNKMRFPESSMQQASDGLLQLAASNARQHRRFYTAIGEPGEAERCSLDERYARYDEKQAMIAKKIKEKTAQEWEDYFQSKHVPATRVRELRETLQDPHLKHRGVLHRHENVPGVGKPVTVPMAAFKFAHDGASIETPPPQLGQHTDDVLASAGYSADEIAKLRKAGAVA